MRAQNIVTLRITIFFLVLGVVTAWWLDWPLSPWLILFLAPSAAAWLTMKLDRQRQGEVLVRCPVQRVSARAVGAAEADTSPWPPHDQLHLHEYARLCAVSYGDDRCEPPAGWTRTLAHGDEVAPYTIRSGWKIEVGGLHWEIWNHATEPVCAIVFRGTEPWQLADWITNARWILRWLTFDQYDQVRGIAQDLVDHARRSSAHGDAVQIVATGHSLGGGLAQHLAYASDAIQLVYSFQSSPVTGYFSVPKAARRKNSRGLRIYRVFEHGEVLSFLHWILRAVVPLSDRNPRIVEARYDFLRQRGVLSMIQQHDMAVFAENLAESAENAASPSLEPTLSHDPDASPQAPLDADDGDEQDP